MADDVEKRITARYILDSTGFNEGLVGINKNLALNQAELKKASVGMQTFGKSSDSLKNIQDSLSKQLELENKKVTTYKDLIDKATTKMNDNIKERDKLKQSVLEANQAYVKAIDLYGEESEEAKKAKKSMEDLTKEYDKADKTVISNAKSIQSYNTNMAKAETAVIRTKGELNKINAELDKSNNKWLNASKSLDSASKKMEKAGSGMTSVGNTMSVGVTAPIIAAGVAIYKLGDSFDEANDSIRTGTGATGKALEGLFNSFKTVYSNVPTTIEGASTAVSELNKRLGLTDKPLEDLSSQILELSRITKTDLNENIQAASRMFQDAGIKSSDYGKALDYIFKTSQNTGIGVAKLMELMTQFGGPLRQMGFDWQTSAAMLGKFEKEGVNTELVVGSLRIALGKMAKDGIKDPAEALQTMIKRIKEAGTAGQANSLALEMFGAKAGPDMAAAIREGRLDLNTLITTLKNSPETINKAAEDTADFAEKFTMLKNKLAVKLEPIGVELLESLDKSMPAIERFANGIAGIVEKFANMSEGQQEAILKTIALTAAIGPVLSVGGKALSMGGSVVSIAGKVAGALGKASVAAEGVGAASTVAAGTGAGVGGLAGLGSALGGAAVAAGPWLIAGAAVAGTGYLIYKGMTQEAIPAVDLFADSAEITSKKVKDANGVVSTSFEGMTVKIDENTKKSVGSYIKMNDDVTKTLTDLYVNSTVITDKSTKSMVDSYINMAAQIKAGMDKHYNDEYTSMQQFYQKSGVLSSTEEQKSLESLKQSNINQKTETDTYVKQIQDIVKKASDEKRALTLDEQISINGIQEAMKNTAVKTLSEDEVQSKVILQRMKDYGTRITTEQASIIIQNANKTRDKAIAAANDQYNKTVTNIIRMRDESHSITADQADKIIADANRQKTESINKAEELRSGVISKLQQMNSETVNNVDTSSGKILTWWDKLKRWWSGWTPEDKNFVYNIQGNVKAQKRQNSSIVPAHASGTDYFAGGLTTLHERGYEVYNLPRGTKIYNHEASEDLVMKTAEVVASKVLRSLPVNNKNYDSLLHTDKVIIANDMDIEALAEKLEFYRLQKSKAYGGG